MSEPLLSSTKHDTKQPDISSNLIETSIEIHTTEDKDDQWCELTIAEQHSLLTSLNRIAVSWCKTVLNKVRFLFTLALVTILNITTRLTSFTRDKTVAQSTSPLAPIVSSPSSNRTFEKDLDYPSSSCLKLNPHLNLSSSETSSMAHILVRQPTPNINIHQNRSTADDNLSPTAHSLDDRIFFYKPDSTSFFQLLQKFASESHISEYQPTANGGENRNPSLSLNKSEGKEAISPFDCNTIQPVISDDTKTSELDSALPATIGDELDEDILSNPNSTSNVERHFRRRKRRSSLTKTSPSTDETKPIITDSIEKVDGNNNTTTIVQEEKGQEINEISPPISTEALPIDENEESDDKAMPSNEISRRRLRCRSYRQTVSASPKPIIDTSIEFFVPTETSISTPPSSPTSSSPVSPTSSNSIHGSLKRSGSIKAEKKMVRFADSVGRELAQVQYIQSVMDDDSQDFSFGKNNLYLPKEYPVEHKPWSFDVALTSKPMSTTPMPRRFFCLYRQPNSEHPDIYLHEIWKSQIKLEHADVRLKSPLTGEQCLYGTVWVTNASYWKNVTVKYSFNRWLNTYEYDTRYRCHSNDFRNIDQFEFSIDIPHDVDRIDFVLRYQINGQEHWDNNGGRNYTIETDSASAPPTLISLPHDCDFNEMRFY